jgi:hypothetical protein
MPKPQSKVQSHAQKTQATCPKTAKGTIVAAKAGWTTTGSQIGEQFSIGERTKKGFSPLFLLSFHFWGSPANREPFYVFVTVGNLCQVVVPIGIEIVQYPYRLGNKGNVHRIVVDGLVIGAVADFCGKSIIVHLPDQADAEILEPPLGMGHTVEELVFCHWMMPLPCGLVVAAGTPGLVLLSSILSHNRFIFCFSVLDALKPKKALPNSDQPQIANS